MNYLITGGAGFIGTNLAEKLMQEGNKVYSLDNLSTGSIRNVDFLREKFGDLFHHETLNLAESKNEGKLVEYIDRSDLIYHLAAVVGVENVENDPIKTIETNIVITSHVIEYAKQKMKGIIFTSTSEVYGKSKDLPFKEDGDITFGPSTQGRWGYGASKYIDEIFALFESKQYGLPITIVRLFNTIGPKQTGAYGMVAPRFIKWALKNEPLKVYGDGEQQRCFTDIDDVVRALTELAKNSKTRGEIYNVGNPKNKIKIKDLASLVIKLTKSKSKILYVPEKKDVMEERMPDISKIKKSIGWQPKISLEDCLTKIIKYEKGIS